MIKNISKISSIIILVLLLFTITGCDMGWKVLSFQPIKTTIDNFEYSEEPKVYYYKQKSELKGLPKDLFGKYNSFYFRKRALVVVTLVDNENNDYFCVPEYFNDNRLRIETEKPQDGNLINWTFIIEISSKHVKPIEAYFFHFSKEIVEPTCQEQGYTLYYYDEIEGPIKSDYTEIVDHVYENGKCIWCEKPEDHYHNYQKETVEPTCQEQGYTSYYCIECGESYKKQYKEIVDHVYENGKCIWCDIDEKKYKLSDYSFELTRETLETSYDDYTTVSSYDPISIWGESTLNIIRRFKLENNTESLRMFDLTEEYDDYYTCCYIDINKKEALDAIDVTSYQSSYFYWYWGKWSGINCNYAKLYVYKCLIDEEEFLELENETIKWFEIPKNEEIPDVIKNEMGEYYLFGISESKDVKGINFATGEEKIYKCFFDARRLYNDKYNDKIVDKQYEEFCDDCNKKFFVVEWYLWELNDEITLPNNKVVCSNSLYEYFEWFSFLVDIIDGVEYIRFKNITMWGDIDIRDIFEYKIDKISDNITYYWFKYDDICDLINGE